MFMRIELLHRNSVTTMLQTNTYIHYFGKIALETRKMPSFLPHSLKPLAVRKTILPNPRTSMTEAREPYLQNWHILRNRKSKNTDATVCVGKHGCSSEDFRDFLRTPHFSPFPPLPNKAWYNVRTSGTFWNVNVTINILALISNQT